MDKLQELRDVHFERQQKKALMLKIAKQFDDINRLRQSKELLQHKLQALQNGCPDTDLYPSYVHDPEFFSLHNQFATLKRKLSTCRLLGPCGLTVLDVQSKSLAVSLTSVWKDKTQTFVLHIASDKDRVKVAGSTIPYFVRVEAMLADNEDLDWTKLMDDLGYRLNAYTQRLREVEWVQSEQKTIVKQLSYNDSVTVVEMQVSVPMTTRKTTTSDTTSNDNEDDDDNSVFWEVKLHLVYGGGGGGGEGIDSVYPDKVNFASSHFIPKNVRTEMRAVLKSRPLSQAFPVLMDKLSTVRVSQMEDEEEEEEGR